ncbi:MAG: hypothetical protein AB7I27_17680 [Bacteriovoracaceae bacterium]
MKLIFLILVLLASFTAYAQEGCPTPSSLNDILECLKDRHQLVQLKDLEVKATTNLDNALGQRPNPILDVQTVHSGNARQTQIILAQEIDLGGKRESLRKKGSLIYESKKNELKLTKEQIIEEVLLNIHHLIHLNETLEVNREVSESLSDVMVALKKRPALTPEQEASLLNFRLQQAEVNNIISLQEDQEEEILLFFYLNGGYKKEDVLRVMEDHHHPLEINRNVSNLSLNLQRIGLEAKLAQEELNFQKATPWEGVTIGPMFMDDKLDGISEKMYGVTFTMPIPLWQTNKAGKAIASINLSNTKIQFDLMKRKEDLQKSSLDGRIDGLKETLKKLPNNDELLKTHKRIEKLYSQGLITPTSFLESHRIWRDVISSKLELEEKILRLSIEFYRLSGTLSEVHL